MKRGFLLRDTKLPTEHVSPDGTATEHASTSASTHNTPFAAGSYTEEAAVGCDMSIICVSDQETLVRPCVDCGQMTGRFCDYCYAADRCPDERWAPNQLTPLCSRCDNTHDKCTSAVVRLGVCLPLGVHHDELYQDRLLPSIQQRCCRACSG